MKKSKSTLKKLALSMAVATVMTCCGATVVLTGCQDGNTPTGIEQSIPINVSIGQFTGGAVTADKTSYVSGDTVTLTVTPSEGYEFVSIMIGEEDKTKSVKNGTLVLENVMQDIAVTAEFKARTAATASVSVINGKGGTASLDKTSGYIGDKVNLTLISDTGYSVISVKVNGVEKSGELNGNVLEITLSEAVVSVDVEFYAIPIKAFVSSNTEYGNAQITSAKEEYQIGDSIEVTFSPNNNCSLASVFVNGEEKISEVSQNKLNVTVTQSGNVNIVALFAVNPVNCEFVVSATKFGKAENLNGASATLIHKTLDIVYRDLTVNVDGKIVAELIPGEYTLEIENYVPAGITVTGNGVENAATVVYQPFNDAVKVDVNTITNGYLSMGGQSYTVTKDGFDDFIYEANLKHTGQRVYIAIYYPDTKDMLTLGFNDSWEGVNYMPMGAGALWTDAMIHEASNWKSSNLTSDEIAAAKSDGLTFKLVRKGTSLYVFVGYTPAEGEYTQRLLHIFGTQFSSGKAEVGICNWTNATMNIPVSISTDTAEIDKLTSSKITIAQGIQNGSIALDKVDGNYIIGETVTVTIAPADGEDENHVFVLDALTIDGSPVTVSGSAYSFTAMKSEYAIGATFKQVTYASIDVAISGLKYGVNQEISKVYLSGAGYERCEHELTNGRLTVNKLPAGEYTIEAEGYIPVKIEAVADKTYGDIALTFDIFNPAGGGVVDTSTLGEGKISMGSNSYIGGKDITDGDGNAVDFVYSATLKSGNGRYLSVAFTGENAKYMISVGFQNNKLRFRGMGGGALWNGVSLREGYNTDRDIVSAKTLTTEQLEKAGGAGLELQIVRKGSTLWLFVENEFFATLGTDFDNGVAAIGLANYQDGENEVRLALSTGTQALSAYEAKLGSTVSVSAEGTGAVSVDKADKKYVMGDTVTVTITPNESNDPNIVNVLKSLTVDGADVTQYVENGKYSFVVTKPTHTVTAVFEQRTFADLTVKVTGSRYDETVSFNKVNLSNTSGYSEEIELTNGVLNATHLTEGEYTVSAEGYLPIKVTVSKDTQTYSDITLVYQIFDENHKDGNVDVSHTNSVTLNSAYAWITSKDSFEGDVMFTTVLKHTGATNYFAVAFLGSKNTFVSVTATDNESVIKLTGFGEGALWTNCQKLVNDTELTLTDTEKAVYKDSGLTLKIVRNGNILCIIIGSNDTERLLISFDVTAYAVQEMQFGMCTFGSSPYTFPVEVTQKADEINSATNATVAASVQGSLGSVSLNKTDGKYNLGETVTVTIAVPADADENTVYTVKSLTVNGVDYSNNVTATNVGFEYAFKVIEKAYAVQVELERTQYANLSVNVSGLKYNASQTLTAVTLKNAAAAYEETHTIENGLLSVQKLIPGEYTIEADGYIAAKVTVATGAQYEDIALIYQPFEVNAGTINLNTYKDGYLQIPGWSSVKSKEDLTGDFIFSAYVKHTAGGDFSRKILAIYFKEQNKAFTVGTNNNLIHEICYMPVTADAIWSGTSYFYGSDWKADAITDGEWAADQKCELTVKVVRKGSKLYIFVGHTPEGGVYTERLLREVETSYTGAVEIGYYNVAEQNNIRINVSKNQEDINALVGNKNLNLTIEFNKYGTKQADITSVKLNDTEYTLTDGKLTVNDLPMGLYTITAEGYAPYTLDLLAENGKTVTMQYQMLTNAKNMSIDTVSEGYVNVPSWGQANLKDGFTGDFVFSINVKHFNHGGYKRTYFLFRLVEENKFLAIGADANNEHVICLMDVGGDALWTNEQVAGGKLQDWETLAMNDEEWAADQAEGITLKLVRKNDKMYLFTSVTATDGTVTDRLIKTFDSAEISGEVQLGFINIADTTFKTPISMDTTEEAVNAMLAKVPTV